MSDILEKEKEAVAWNLLHQLMNPFIKPESKISKIKEDVVVLMCDCKYVCERF